MNIVLLVLDTARGDVTNAMLDAGDLPNVARLVDNGTRFTNARANGPWTVPSHGAMFTGEYPSQSGVHGASPEYTTVPLVEELADRGFETAGFSANPWLSEAFGFDSSFDVFSNTQDYYPDGASIRELFGVRDQPLETGQAYLRELRKGRLRSSLGNIGFWGYQRTFRRDSGGNYLLSRAGDWLHGEDRRFAFINVTEPHLQYELPAEWFPSGIDDENLQSVLQDTTLHNAGVEQVTDDDLTVLRETYRATLRYVDDRIGRLVERSGPETVFVVTGDHGEHFGEHRRFGHQYSLYDELLDVPLVVSGPGMDSAPVTDVVELRSLYDFLIGLADGRMQLPEPSPHHIAETISPHPTVDQLREKATGTLPEYVLQYQDGARRISKGDRTLIEFPDGRTETGADDGETDDLRSTLRETCGEMVRGRPADVTVSKSTEARLDDLGYL